MLSEDSFDQIANARASVEQDMAYIKSAIKTAQQNIVSVDIKSLEEAIEKFKELERISHGDGTFLSSEIIDNQWVGNYRTANNEIQTITRTFDQLTNTIVETSSQSMNAANSVDDFISSMGRKWQDLAR